MEMRDILFFDKMLTPLFINVVYWVLLALVLLAGLNSIFGGGITFTGLIVGLITICIGAFLVRVWCELMLVMFKMNEALQEIRKKQ